MRTAGPLGRILTLTVALAVGACASADAATVSVTTREEGYGGHDESYVRTIVSVRDDRGVPDAVRVTAPPRPTALGRITVVDPAGLTPQDGCAAIDPTTVACVADLTSIGLLEVDARLGDGDDRFEAGAGIDEVTVEGGGGADELLGPAVVPQLGTVLGTAMTFDGGAGTDVLRARSSRSAYVRSSPGPDLIDLGEVRGDITYYGSPRPVRVDLRTGLGRGGDAEGDRIVGQVGTLRGSRHGDHLRSDDDGGSRLDGVDGDDVLVGGSGEDTLDGGRGDNVLLGGPGDDELSVGDSYSSSRARNRLRGQRGDDVLRGSHGTDAMDGGPGRDVFSEVSKGDTVAARDRTGDSVRCRRGARRVRPRSLWVDRLDVVDRFCAPAAIRRGAR